MLTIVRHLLAILMLPTVMALLVPQWLLWRFATVDTRWPSTTVSLIPRACGVALILGGVVLVGWCILLFARIGQGTLAPWDPTSRLVVVGPYRYTRNPMISGVAATLVGQALLTGSRALVLWALAFITVNHAYFLLAEEPGLERRFGEAYTEYKRRVPRWIPTITPLGGRN